MSRRRLQTIGSATRSPKYRRPSEGRRRLGPAPFKRQERGRIEPSNQPEDDQRDHDEELSP